jgi:hypothetical protein
MALEPWYKVATPRSEVREGRSFNPDGDKGVEALGSAAKTTPPGTEAIARIFHAAGAPVLLLFDEFSVTVSAERATNLASELRQVLEELRLTDAETVRFE